MVVAAGSHADGGGGALKGRVVLALGALADSNAADDVQSALGAQWDEGRAGCVANDTSDRDGSRMAAIVM
jgi:hypothetical protein